MLTTDIHILIILKELKVPCRQCIGMTFNMNVKLKFYSMKKLFIMFLINTQ